MSVQLTGAGAFVSSGWHGPNASASLGDDAFAEAVNKEKRVMNVCTCMTCDSGHVNAGCDTLGVPNTCRDNKWSDFSLEGGSAHAWDEGVALLIYPQEETLPPSGTCIAKGGETLGATWQSRPTIESTQGEKLLRTGARDFVRAIVDKIITLMTAIQRGPLRSETAKSADLFPVSSGCAGWRRTCASFDHADSSLLEDEQGELEWADQAAFAPHSLRQRAAHALAHCTPLTSPHLRLRLRCLPI